MAKARHAAGRTAEQLRREAQAALGRAALGATMSPLFPTEWPPTSGGSVFYVYRREPLPTGTVQYRVRGPSERVVFAGPDAAAQVEPMPASDLGTEAHMEAPPSGLREDLERAQQALVDVIGGARTPGDARHDLAAYRTWLDQSPLVRKDLQSRSAAFVSWLDADR